MSTPPPQPGLPPVDAAERVRLAYTNRHESDYVFSNPGLDIFLVVVTCGLWGLYIFYQLMRRTRDHNRRRLELFDAATTLAWEEATRRGNAEALRPNFERVQQHLDVMRAMSGEFRDPVIWLLLAVLTGIAAYVGYIFIDGDLIKHDRASGGVESELREIYATFGVVLPAPDPARLKDEHNYVGRIIAAIATCGIYSWWWLYNLMDEGNRVYEACWPWEDELAQGVQGLAPADEQQP